MRRVIRIRKLLLTLSAAVTLASSQLEAQLPRPRFVGGVAANITGSPGCSECDWGKAKDVALGLMFRDAFSLEYERTAWKALDDPGQSMSLSLVTLGIRAPSRI